ncbi:MAG: YihY/virulence factor BrkB family protein [Neomegalonema sp.]
MAQSSSQTADPNPSVRTSVFGIAGDVLRTSSEKSLSLVAAGVAFYLLLALTPMLTVAVSVYGLVADPATFETHLDALQGLLPPDAFAFLDEQFRATMGSSELTLTWAAGVSFAIALWSASLAVRGLMTAMRLNFPNAHQYGAAAFFVLSLLFTLSIIVLLVLVISIIVALPLAFGALKIMEVGGEALHSVAPVVMFLLATAVLTIVYRLSSLHGREYNRVAIYAAMITTLLWLGGSKLLTAYAVEYADFGKTYGPFAAVAGLMLWFWMSAYLLLLGAVSVSTIGRALDARSATSA